VADEVSTGPAAPSPEATAFWAAVKAAPQQVSLPLAQRRAAGELAETATSEPAGAVRQDWPEHHGLRMSPSSGRVSSRVLYLFGGGYVLGSPQSRWKTAGHLALSADAEVFVPGYRLAPEHPFPAGLDDVLAAWTTMSRTDLPCFVAGDSSGGGMALALALLTLEREMPRPRGVIAFSPWADLTCSGDSFADHADRDIECTFASLTEMAGWYAPHTDRRQPLLSPVFGDPSSFPPVLAFVGSEEVLLDDATRVVRASGGAGNDATLVVGAGMQHVYPIWCGAFPEADQAMRQAGAWVLGHRPAADRTDPHAPLLGR
jgi:acetyl esterase/lipase